MAQLELLIDIELPAHAVTISLLLSDSSRRPPNESAASSPQESQYTAGTTSTRWEIDYMYVIKVSGIDVLLTVIHHY